MTDDGMLFVVRLCVQGQAAYGHQTDRMFWRSIAKRLYEARGKEHQTFGRAVAKLVRERRDAVALLGSGEQDGRSSLTDALDDWIAVVDSRKAVKQARLDAQGTADGDSATSAAWRQASLALWSDKTQLLRAASRSYQQDEDNDDSSTNLSTPPPTLLRPRQRRRQRETTSASPATIPPEDAVAIGLGRLIGVVESVAESVTSQIGAPQSEKGRGELDAAVERRLGDLESKISAVDQNVATMLAMMVEQRQRQGLEGEVRGGYGHTS